MKSFQILFIFFILITSREVMGFDGCLTFFGKSACCLSKNEHWYPIDHLITPIGISTQVQTKVLEKTRKMEYYQMDRPSFNANLSKFLTLTFDEKTESLKYKPGSIDDLNYANENGIIYSDINPASLPIGIYTFVFNQRGHFRLGKVEDRLEHGAKHFILANGDRIVAAGEMRVEEISDTERNKKRRQLTYNIFSGTFSPHLINKYLDNNGRPAAEKKLQRAVVSLFNILDSSALFVRNQLIAELPSPSFEKMEQLCVREEFCRFNSQICEFYELPETCKEFQIKWDKEKLGI